MVIEVVGVDASNRVVGRLVRSSLSTFKICIPGVKRSTCCRTVRAGVDFLRVLGAVDVLVRHRFVVKVVL
jgi:hypothetical protein